MNGMLRLRAVGIALLAASAVARAGEITPEQIARVKHDEKAAMDAVAARHGNRQPSEMGSEERGQVIHEQEAASRGALEKNKVDAKGYARREATLSLDERKAVDEEAKKIEAEDAAKKAAEEKKKAGDQKEKGADEVVVQGGNANPVDIYQDENIPPVDNMSEDADSAAEGAAADPTPAAKTAPAKKASRAKAKAAAKGGKRHHR